MRGDDHPPGAEREEVMKKSKIITAAAAAAAALSMSVSAFAADTDTIITAPSISIDNVTAGSININSYVQNIMQGFDLDIGGGEGGSETVNSIITAPNVNVNGVCAGALNINQIINNIIVSNNININIDGDSIGQLINGMLGGM